MSTYAIVNNGTVEGPLFTPPSGVSIAQAFPGMTAVDVTSISPQPQAGWTATEANGVWTFAAPVAPTPTNAQAAAALIAQGVTITSTSTPTLNGVYACDPSAQANIDSTMISILANGVFVNGGTTLAWLDLSGSPHVFPSVTEFKGFATAIGEIVAQVDEYAGGVLSSPPSMSVTIP